MPTQLWPHFPACTETGKRPSQNADFEHFVQYVASEGQDEAAKLAYAKLPPQLQQQDQGMLAQVATSHAAGGWQ